MKKTVITYMDIPDKVYVINYVYNYRDCEFAEWKIYENMFFYDRETAYNYAKLKGLNYPKYEIEELRLGAINKNEIVSL